jgi:hypothetical protein
MTDTKAIPRGHDTRAGVRRLIGVVAELGNQIQQLRLVVTGEAIEHREQLRRLRSEIAALRAPAPLSGPYWEARAKALYDRRQECLEPTYPERIRGIEEKLSIRGQQLQPPWQGQELQGNRQDTGPREG